MSLVSALVLVSFDMPNGSRLVKRAEVVAGTLRPRFSATLVKYGKLAWLTFPIGCTMLMNSLSCNVSRYYIDEYVGVNSLGIFAAVASLLGAGRMMAGALGQSACPRLACLYTAGDRIGFITLMWKIINISGLIGLVPLAACIVAGKSILALLFKPEYAHEAGVLVWLMASGVLTFIVSGLGVVLTAVRCFKVQVPLSAVGLLTAVLTSHLLIRSDGMRGAAISLFATSACQLLCYLIAVYSLIQRFPWGPDGDGHAEPTGRVQRQRATNDGNRSGEGADEIHCLQDWGRTGCRIRPDVFDSLHLLYASIFNTLRKF